MCDGGEEVSAISKKWNFRRHAPHATQAMKGRVCDGGEEVSAISKKWNFRRHAPRATQAMKGRVCDGGEEASGNRPKGIFTLTHHPLVEVNSIPFDFCIDVSEKSKHRCVTAELNF
ncbi:hypothetical protein CKA32_000111 [Geitlerinema sp. FC II]|nr:hypothetical protein CKA32_000111 [Geitlerinema sp. FC II]